MSNQPVAWLGVDPGVHGAIALVHPNVSLSRSWDLPTLKVPAPGNKRTKSGALRYRTILDETKIIEVLTRIREAVGTLPLVGVIEAVAPMRHKGKSGKAQSEGPLGAFNFGASWGLVRGLVRPFCQYYLAYPVAWRPKMVGTGEAKSSSIALASELFPHLEFPRKKDEHRAEALLLAVYGSRHLTADIDENTGEIRGIYKSDVPNPPRRLSKVSAKSGGAKGKRTTRHR